MEATSDMVSTRRVDCSQATSGYPTRGLVAMLRGESVEVGRLVEVVDLQQADPAELLDQPRRVDPVGHEGEPHQPAGHLAQRRQIGLDDVADPGTLHLDDGLGEAAHPGVIRRQSGAMHLPERGRRDRVRVELLEDAGERSAEALLGDPPDVLEGHRRGLVLEAGELLCDLGRQDVHPGGHELAELDHQAAQLRGQVVEAARQLHHPPVLAAHRHLPQADPRQHDVEPPHAEHLRGGEPEDPVVANPQRPAAAPLGGPRRPDGPRRLNRPRGREGYVALPAGAVKVRLIVAHRLRPRSPTTRYPPIRSRPHSSERIV
jgi:hypothetical protein